MLPLRMNPGEKSNFAAPPRYQTSTRLSALPLPTALLNQEESDYFNLLARKVIFCDAEFFKRDTGMITQAYVLATVFGMDHASLDRKVRANATKKMLRTAVRLILSRTISDPNYAS